jgi:indole-3-glycerol phosphate synthase
LSLTESGRPIYYPVRAADDAPKVDDVKAIEEAENQQLDAKDEKSQQHTKSSDVERKAPRGDDGELILKRREIHSGRALTVSTVEWSVAENMATPTSVLEGFMWDKETEVDRFRERVPLSNLVSQWRLGQVDPSIPKPRDWIGPVKEAAAGGQFVIIPECKRMEPVTGSLRKRFDVSKLVKEFMMAGVPAMSVNCDGVLFGGSLEDLTKAREETAKAAMEIDSQDGVVVPPILGSDLLLYPYQLYKLQSAGADAVNLIVGALEPKDLVYLTKIASSLKMQTLLSVTSSKQIENLNILSPGSIDGLVVSNRELENFSFDLTGQQALDILESEALKEFRKKHGEDTPVFVEGRVGIIKSKNDGTTAGYIHELQEAGAIGAFVGGGLVPDEGNKSPLVSLLQAS